MSETLRVLRSTLGVLCLALPFGLLAGCGAPTPASIADDLADRVAEDFAGAETFTVRGRIPDGPPVVLYFRRSAADSLAAYEMRAVTDDSLRRPIFDPYRLPNVAQLARGLRGNARLVETMETPTGEVFVLEADDPARLIGAPGDGADDLGTARLYIDAETSRLRELRFTLPNPDSAAAEALVQRLIYDEYQATGGVTLPHRSTQRIEGIPITEDDRLVAMGQLQFARAQAQQLPPAERAARLRELDRQEQYYTTGIQEDTFEVQEVTVNTDVPSDLFRR